MTHPDRPADCDEDELIAMFGPPYEDRDLPDRIGHLLELASNNNHWWVATLAKYPLDDLLEAHRSGDATETDRWVLKAAVETKLRPVAPATVLVTLLLGLPDLTDPNGTAVWTFHASMPAVPRRKERITVSDAGIFRVTSVRYDVDADPDPDRPHVTVSVKPVGLWTAEHVDDDWLAAAGWHRIRLDDEG